MTSGEGWVVDSINPDEAGVPFWLKVGARWTCQFPTNPERVSSEVRSQMTSTGVMMTVIWQDKNKKLTENVFHWTIFCQMPNLGKHVCVINSGAPAEMSSIYRCWFDTPNGISLIFDPWKRKCHRIRGKVPPDRDNNQLPYGAVLPLFWIRIFANMPNTPLANCKQQSPHSPWKMS